MISFIDVSYSIAGRCLLNEVNLLLPPKTRLGLIGRNGAGKSTLFRLILNKLQCDGGLIEIQRGLKIASVAQEVPLSELSILEYTIASDQERTLLLHALETCEDPHKMADLYENLIHIDAYGAEARASKILLGLGFSDEMQKRPLNAYSGGFKMRVLLGCALFQEPDLLLLDEPTNHLDFEAVTWLKDFLKSYPKTLLIISHDRDLLNACIDEVIHLHHQKLTRYRGNFDQFQETYHLQQTMAVAHNTKMQAQKDHWQSFVDRFKSKATKARQAQSRMKAISKLKFIDIHDNEATISFEFPKPENLAHPLISYDKVSLGYPDGEDAPPKVILKNISGLISPNDRIALLGMNGNGKSTFAKFLAERLKPIKGTQTRSNKLKVGYFDQHQLDALRGHETPYIHAKDLLPDHNETQVRAHLGRFGFSGDRCKTLVRDLSGGEKVRLSFALICIHKPAMLVLDEPTNHLDMEMEGSLIRSLSEFEGAVVIISHDWHFLMHTVDSLWIVHNQNIEPFSGSLEDYQKWILTGKGSNVHTFLSKSDDKKSEKKSNTKGKPTTKQAKKK